MKRVSFFREHILHLLILGGVLVWLTYRFVYDIQTRDYDMISIDAISIVGMIIIVTYGLYQRNVANWCIAEVNASRIITYTLFKKKLCEIDLSKPVYCATVWIPGDKYNSTRVLVVSNEPFPLPAKKERFRKQYKNSQQALLINCWASSLDATCVTELDDHIPYRIIL